MKRIESIIKTEAFPDVKNILEKMNVYSLSRHDISADSIISNHDINSKKGLFLSKIEFITSDKDASKVINTIAKYTVENGKFFISDVNEIIDTKTFASNKDSEDIKISTALNKRSRLVPLQKYTMATAEKFYNTYKHILHSEYRIRSYSDFINFCIVSYINLMEDNIKRNTIIDSHTR
jgi:nitrogen regulatory protein P-II 1